MMKRLCPRRLGSFVQANAQRLLLLLSLALLFLCAAINSGKLDTDLSNWIHRTNRVVDELQAIEAAIGEGSGTNSLLLLQTPQTKTKNHHHKQQIIKHKQQHDALENDILSVDSLMIHLEALAIATHVTVDLFDISWSLKDLCFSPTLPDYEGLLVNQMLDHLMPCAIKTPLDCFWEGSKLMGPEQEVRLSSIGPKLKWTNLNPLAMVEAKRRAHPHASFPYDALIAWMKRTGITTGYQDRPCLDPSDPNCPTSAPNKMSGERPNIAVELTNGCHGLASKQMHWKEEEIVGGIQHNSSGYIVRASALQSTIQLMGERDVYDYWRKTSKVQDVNNWSTDKARQVLDSWQKRFEDELAQFMRTSVASSAYMIHALAPKSMMEPIDSETVMDQTNFKLSVVLFTIAACILFPRFGGKVESQATANQKIENTDDVEKSEKPDEDYDENDISRFKLIILAFISSLHVILTFFASLGLSSFMNLPFNMMTTQILPPLALYYGFRQSLLIANMYARHHRETTHLRELNTRCLNELLPVVFTEAATLIVPLVVASALPVQATRVFTFQAITYIALSTLTATLLVPALITTFLARNSSPSDTHQENDEDRCTIYMKYKTSNYKRSSTPRDSASRNSCDAERSGPTIEEFILSRLQDDLRHIRADSQQPTNINFSAQVKPSSTRASLKLTASRPPTSSSTLNAVGPLATQELLNQQQQQYQEHNQYELALPDLIAWSAKSIDAEHNDVSDAVTKPDCEDNNCDETTTKVWEPRHPSHILRFSSLLVSNRICQALVCLFSLVMFVALLLQCPSVKYGLHLRDIVLSGTPDYDSLMMQEKYFPVYNTFIITQDNFDYPNNQRLLYELHERVTQVEGVVDDNDQSTGESKFWLIYFRDWLLELQANFDSDRNRSSITSEGWSPDASDASKLAYKLLVQTGRVDNPIDKHLVETNRLVDKTGIINPKAFYYYLTAWVMNDAFTYSNSEANFRPEPRTWNENAEDLRIERARPLVYAQIPILMKLPEAKDGLRTIIELRAISQAFEQLGLPNFLTGIPFIFWDQFINLDLLFIAAYSVIAIIYICLACYALANFSLALVLVGPALVTGVELYGLLGFFSIEFNTVIAVLLVSSMGTATLQTIHYVMNFQCAQGDFNSRLNQSFGQSFRTIITSLSLLLIAAFIYGNSKMDFMTKYSLVFYCLTAVNCFNSLVLTSVLIALFAPTEEVTEVDVITPEVISKDNRTGDISKIIKSYDHRLKKHTTAGTTKQKMQSKSKKRQSFQRVQSEISLSTISEESRTDSRTCESKLDFSIRC